SLRSSWAGPVFTPKTRRALPYLRSTMRRIVSIVETSATVAIKSLIAEREPFAVDDKRNDHLLAVGTMIARVAAHHHRILFRRALHVRAGQVIEQHIELRHEQLTVTLFEMLLQLRLVRQNPVQTPVQPGVVDLAFLDLEQIIQSRAGGTSVLQWPARCPAHTAD